MRDLIEALAMDEAALPVVRSNEVPRVVFGTVTAKNMPINRAGLTYSRTHVSTPSTSKNAAAKTGEAWAKSQSRGGRVKAAVDYLIYWAPERKWSAVVSYE